MAECGLYVHVPYCRYVCPYCDFNVVAHKKPPWQRFLQAAVAELQARAPLFQQCRVRSLYFGGGTPSLLPAEFFAAVYHAAGELFSWHPEPEITVEVNPGTVDQAALDALRGTGVNRLSIGWQSSQQRLLKTLGRDHTAEESRDVVLQARQAGFANISLDFIFAVPGQTREDVQRDIDAIQEVAPEHVSLYAMTFHEGTPFYRRRAAGRLKQVDEDLEVQMSADIAHRLVESGYEHYEVGNFAKPGRRAVHNSLYWQSVPYLGIGPGAHSFTHQEWQVGWRWEGTRNPEDYMHAWTGENPVAAPWEAHAPRQAAVSFCETLQPKQLLCERMFCGLRTRDGVSLREPAIAPFREWVVAQSQVALERRWLVLEHDRLMPTPSGLLFADSVAQLYV